MATQYMITTNGVDFGTRFTSKARAISEAETIGKVAAERAHGDVVEVQTVKTGKVVWTETYYTHNEGLKFGPVVEITGDVDVPASITTADGPVEDDGVPFEVRHAAYVESLKSDPEVMAMYASEAAQTSVPTGYVGVMQNVPGFNADEHIHASGCRDITREMRKFGQSEGDTFPYPSDFTVWDIFENNDGGRAADSYTEGTLEHAQEMIFNASAEIRIMPCAASLPLGVTPFGPLIDAGGQYMISEESAPVSTGVRQCGCGTCFNDTMGVLCWECELAQCSEGENCRVLPEEEEERITVPEGQVVAAIVPTHAPNGVPWEELRNLIIWGDDCAKLEEMINRCPSEWGIYTLPNGDMVASWYVGTEIVSVFVVERRLEEYRVRADIRIMIPGLNNVSVLEYNGIFLCSAYTDEEGEKDIARRYVESREWPIEAESAILVLDMCHVPWA